MVREVETLARLRSRLDTRTRLNISLAVTFVIVFCITSVALRRSLVESAMEQVRRDAIVQMEMALAVRQYTIENVRPLLPPGQSAFYPPAIPAFAALRTMALLEQNHPDTLYQELVLNPTNPANRASGWQLDVISSFRGNPSLTEWSHVSEMGAGRVLQVARPIRPTVDCMSCHGAPAQAPPAMREHYGDRNGFHWRVGDVVGMQMVTVPATAALAQAQAAWWRHVGANIVVFMALFVVLNRVLAQRVIGPIEDRTSAWRELATRDSLTGAWNRRSFDEQAGALMQGGGGRPPLTVVAMDIDCFKSINDGYGHDVGDRVLREFVQRVLQVSKRRDRLFRLGGEEFVLLLLHTPLEAAAKFAETLRCLLQSSPFSEVGRLTASFGVAALMAGDTAESLMRRVDAAVYEAKARGRNCVVVAPDESVRSAV
jgi:diguanylate cyclase (GGDEF)-like protein